MNLALDSRIGRIEADPGQIEQVIMNLAVNARDAMPRGGRLTIETTSAQVDGEFLRRHGIQGGPGVRDHVLLAITDTGIGMDEATRKRIFEPDVVMPGQIGPELFERLKPIRPGMRVWYLSGYMDDVFVRRGMLTPGTPFLQKPFTAATLNSKVREVLEAGSDPRT